MSDPDGQGLLLDTHTFLGMASAPDRLGSQARTRIEEPSTRLFLSLASVWEMAIKSSIGKLELSSPLGSFLEDQLGATRTAVLDLTLEQILEVERLPFHHRDPFDRLLVAQAKVERLPVVTADAAFDGYPVQRIW